MRTQVFGAVGSLVSRITDMFVSGSIVGVDAPVSSLRSFVIAGLVRVVQSRQYLNTIGCSRAMFTFASDPISEVTHTPKERIIQPCN